MLTPGRDLIPLLTGQRRVRRGVTNHRMSARHDIAVGERLTEADWRSSGERGATVIGVGGSRQQRPSTGDGRRYGDVDIATGADGVGRCPRQHTKQKGGRKVGHTPRIRVSR